MSYKPFQMPEELHAWLKARAERLTEERGASVSMNDVLRETFQFVETCETAPQTNGRGQPQAVQP